ncbi:MAG: hypothetical protein ACE5G2_12235, partial [Candidatus Krumholzibacteriia bacterium]
MKRRRILHATLALGMAGILSTAGCGKHGRDASTPDASESDTTASNTDREPTTPGTPDATRDSISGWVVIVGSQGGFTGGGSGHRILADGTVLAWSQLTPEHPVTTERLGEAPRSRLDALYRAMTSADLRAVTMQQTGNMTTFLEW